MQSLLEEMQQCKSVKACVELALTDAYGEYEQSAAWLACIEEMFGRFDRPMRWRPAACAPHSPKKRGPK